MYTSLYLAEVIKKINNLIFIIQKALQFKLQGFFCEVIYCFIVEANTH